ncbi:MAG: hypothetical protein K5682_02700 [Lachnospiraceae bacterium]|nr:hypothetical protein [Lachnospiraceae bacterium]
MKQKILAIYDGERAYCSALAGRLSAEEYMPYQVCGFSEEEALLEYQTEHPVEVLLVSENKYRPGLLRGSKKTILVLKETGKEITYEEEVHEIPRFQTVQGIYRSILRYCDAAVSGSDRPGRALTMVGFFSPIKRCLQTTAALELGKKLAMQEKTLFLDFECFSALGGNEPSRQEGDLTDLVYYMDCARAQFPSRFESLIHKVGEMDVIYGPRSFIDFDLVEKEKWMALLEEIRNLRKYRYILLDLCEQTQGIFDLLGECDGIITIEKQDPVSRTKLERYENLLQVTGHGDLLQKSYRWNLPAVQLPPDPVNGDSAELRKFLEYAEGNELWNDPREN